MTHVRLRCRDPGCGGKFVVLKKDVNSNLAAADIKFDNAAVSFECKAA